MSGVRAKTGHLLARVLGIPVNERHEAASDPTTRGESVFSVQTVDSYIEQEPTTIEWVKETLPDRHDLVQYVRSLFPFTHWIGRYNLQWFTGDLIAGQ